MSSFLNIRLTKDMPSLEEIDEAAKRYDMNRTELTMLGLEMLMSFDEEFYNRLKVYSDSMRIPMWLVIQNMLIKRMAEEQAEKDIWGDAPRMLPEFMFTVDGPLTGEALFNTLYEAKLQEEATKRVEDIKTNVLQYGLEPSEEEKEILNKFGGGI